MRIFSTKYHTRVGLRVFAQTALLSCFAQMGMASNSVELVDNVAGYQISRVAASKVCFASYSGASAKDVPSFFATYKKKDGDRWQVTGYVGKKETPTNSDVLTIRFDDEDHMIIEVELSKGTYFLPFTSAVELKEFDKKVADKDTVTFSLLRSKDSLTLELDGFRQAKAAIDTCLMEIK